MCSFPFAIYLDVTWFPCIPVNAQAQSTICREVEITNSMWSWFLSSKLQFLMFSIYFGICRIPGCSCRIVSFGACLGRKEHGCYSAILQMQECESKTGCACAGDQVQL